MDNEQKKKKRRLIIIILAIVLFLFLLSFSAFYFFNSGAKSGLEKLDVPPGPTVTFVARPTRVLSGERAKISWSSDADSCIPSGDEASWFFIADPSNGSVDTDQIKEDQTYSIACTSPAGTTIKSITISVMQSASENTSSGTINERAASDAPDAKANTPRTEPKIACLELKRDLKNKDTGADVLAIQKFLVSQELLLSAPTGTFGPATLAGVTKFQSIVLVPPTGTVGPSTRTAIKNVSCAIAGETLTPGKVSYFKKTDQRWWLSDADLPATFQGVMLGIAQIRALAGERVDILVSGRDNNQSELSTGSKYYLSNTAGRITSSENQTNKVRIGTALSPTTILIHNGPAFTCTDKVKNGDETGVDIGGHCVTGSTITCTDGIKNGDEASVDAGGHCTSDISPQSGSCFDGFKNGNETGVDTGGRCVNAGPCVGLNCSNNPVGATGTCGDGIKNDDETGIDTGGRCDLTDPSFTPRLSFSMSSSEMPLDADGKPIFTISSIIVSPKSTATLKWIATNTTRCTATSTPIIDSSRTGGTCSDEVRNGNETAIDLGGRCTNPVWPSSAFTSAYTLPATTATTIIGTAISNEITGASTVSITCVGSGGTTTKNIKVDILQAPETIPLNTSTPPGPIVTFDVQVDSLIGLIKNAIISWKSKAPSTEPDDEVEKCYAKQPLIIPLSNVAVIGWGDTTATTDNLGTTTSSLNTQISNLSLSPTAITYTIVCKTKRSGITSKSMTKIVSSLTVGTPVVSGDFSITSFVAAPSTAIVGTNSTLTWTTTRGGSCSIKNSAGSSSVPLDASGSFPVVVPIVGPNIFTLTCKDAQGTSSDLKKEVTVTGKKAPEITSFTAALGGGGKNTNLSWTTTDVDSCTLGGETVPAQGTKTVSIDNTSTQTYTLICTGTGVTRSKALTINMTTAACSNGAAPVATYTTATGVENWCLQ